MKNIKYLLGILFSVAPITYAASFGIGVSSEPADISGGGFLLDIVGVIELKSPFRVHVNFSVGPLPVQPRLFFIDVTGVVEFPLNVGQTSCLNMLLYIGAGAGFSSVWSFTTNVLGGVELAVGRNIDVFLQASFRSFSGSFISVGYGVKITF